MVPQRSWCEAVGIPGADRNTIPLVRTICRLFEFQLEIYAKVKVIGSKLMTTSCAIIAMLWEGDQVCFPQESPGATVDDQPEPEANQIVLDITKVLC